MLRARILKLDGKDYRPEEQAAFDLLRDGLLDGISNRKSTPKLVYIPIRLFGDVAPCASIWQVDGPILLLIHFIREEMW